MYGVFQKLMPVFFICFFKRPRKVYTTSSVPLLQTPFFSPLFTPISTTTMGHDIAKRAIVVACKANGISNTTISEQIGLSASTIRNIYQRALENGFDPNSRPWTISDAMLADAPRSGRPTKRSLDVQNLVLSKVRLDQEKTYADIAEEMRIEGFDVSSSTVWRVMKDAGLTKTRPPRKPPVEKVTGDLASTSTRHNEQPADSPKASDSGTSS
jgi:transposase